jgi:L-seryl-tRNA(Ser) seleniumtransferase
LARRKEVAISRSELIEIGGSFRMPDIMARAGCKLVEVGTTNRTHSKDFEDAISPKTALLMKVHASNFEITGFTKTMSEQELASIAQRHDLPLVTDLGSGALIDLESFHLPHETTVAEALKAGADVVTFSGDKLLGGPQAGIIAGRHDMITKIKRNPMTRAMRPDKLSLAAMAAVLRLYTNPSQLATELPTLRWLSRDVEDIEQLASRIVPIIQNHCKGFLVVAATVHSQVGSGALPSKRLASAAVKITLPRQNRPSKALIRLAQAFRDLPIPVIGRITDDALWFDLRCLEDESGFIANLERLNF